MTDRTGRAPARRAAATALTAVATAAIALTGTPALAAGGAVPAFLEPAQLPPHPASAWYAGPVTSGVPDPLPFCVGETLPGATSRYRQYWTEFDTNARQITVVERDEARAKTLAELLNQAVRTCAARVEQQDPDTTAEWRNYGTVDVEEGARVHGVRTTHAWTGNDVHLFSVGRDGRTVTVVHWAQMGTFEHAQVSDFRKTTHTAVDKLY
ncbi:hypothetical protein [Streptomyces sp. NPDC053048]|uniref:hypothetical protein n=1 Tax=Streptomyces sp. NPDC053048 TaxID=3365694 RepID=UPI0037D19F04